MQLVQILLPLRRRDGTPIPRATFDHTRALLTERFGGATAFTRSPAVGTWVDPEGDVEKDDIVTVEVLCDSLDRVWWKSFARSLESDFDQDEILIRALPVERL